MIYTGIVVTMMLLYVISIYSRQAIIYRKIEEIEKKIVEVKK